MENSRDSSIWRSLAVAFGDGLAFGVGMALSQKAGRREALPAPEPSGATAPMERLAALEARLAQLEKAPLRLDPKALEAIVGVIENDLRARDEHYERRLADTANAVQSAAGDMAIAARREIAADLRLLEAQWDRRIAEAIEAARSATGELNANLRQDVVADLHTLEAQGLALQQELTESIPRIIEERVTALLEVRTAELQEQLIAVRGREVAELREALAAADRRMADLLTAIGQTCRDAAERMSPPAPPAPPAVSAEPSATPENTDPGDTPKFDVELRRAWTLPLVSSLLAFSGCLMFLHWM